MRRACISVAFAVALGGNLAAQSPPAERPLPVTNGASARVQVNVAPPAPTYQADVEARIADALIRARDENRRVLIQWGSNSDQSSQALIQTTLKNRDVAHTLLYEYEVVRADVTGNRRAAATYKADLQNGGIPYLTVLDAGRKVLAHQPAAPFKAQGEGEAAYDGKKLDDFLKKHQAPYLDANLLFKSALARAKAEQKTLFVWFSAPW
jgi:hypothetical protein